MTTKIKYDNIIYDSIKHLCETKNINYRLVLQRRQAGLSLEEALNNTRSITLEGVMYRSLQKACKFYNIHTSTVYGRLYSGWTLEQAFEIEKRDIECKGIVYKIYNTVNDKVYIGVTTRKCKNRFAQHKLYARNGVELPLYEDMRKLGLDKFKVVIIKRTNCCFELKRLETAFIKKYSSKSGVYNVRITGGCFGGKYGNEVEYKGKSYSSISELARELNMLPELVSKRIKKGIDIESPITYKAKPQTYKGVVYPTIVALCKAINMSHRTVTTKLQTGMSIEEIIKTTKTRSRR